MKYISVYALEFDINAGAGTTVGQGSAPVMMMENSIDGGNTFEPEQLLELGAIGEYAQRVQTGSLGTSRNWVISFSISDPIDIVVMQAVARGSFSSW